MDAVKFLQERNRMFLSGAATPGIELEDDFDPVKAVEIIEKWSEQHPRRTRQSVFLEQYPEAEIDEQGYLSLCPRRISADCRSRVRPCTKRLCSDCCREFWMQEVE